MKTSQKAVIGAKILSSRLLGRPRPFFLQFSLLNDCVSRCVYCNAPNRSGTRLPTAELRRVLGEFARLGTVRVKLYGGEPLLHQDIVEIIREVKRLGMRCAMVTNGLLFEEKMEAVRLLDEIIISLDGSEVAHDRQRGQGTWKRVLRAVEACAAEGLDFFLTATVTRQNLGEVEWLLDTARRFGVMVNFQLTQFCEELFGPSARDYMPSPEEARAVLRRIIAAKEAGAPVLFTARSYRHTLDWPDYAYERREEVGRPSPCMAGRYFVQMEPDGDIYPCFLQIGSFEPLNVTRDGVEVAWRHAQRHQCHDCYNTWLNENKAIFSLRPAVVANFWRHYMNTPRRRRDLVAPP